jgi:hypothetical protein
MPKMGMIIYEEDMTYKDNAKHDSMTNEAMRVGQMTRRYIFSDEEYQ